MTEQQAWKVAAALAHTCGLDWGAWAMGYSGWCGRKSCPCSFDGQCCCESAPVHDPSDVEAYKADCLRRGVEPGPLPALCCTAPAESYGGLSWYVHYPEGLAVSFSLPAAWGVAAVWRLKRDSIMIYELPIQRTTLAWILELARVAAEAMQ